VKNNENIALALTSQENVQYDASGVGLLKSLECCHMEGGGCPNRHVTFTVAEKV